MPADLCRCGCGQSTPIAKRNRYDLGHVKGKPVPYCPGHNSQKPKSIQEFWSQAIVDEETQCWTGGSGLMIDGKFEMRAHRVAWKLTHGSIPDGMVVCHKCDNPPCFNPDHLFLGTQADNVADMIAKVRLS